MNRTLSLRCGSMTRFLTRRSVYERRLSDSSEASRIRNRREFDSRLGGGGGGGPGGGGARFLAAEPAALGESDKDKACAEEGQEFQLRIMYHH